MVRLAVERAAVLFTWHRGGGDQFAVASTVMPPCPFCPRTQYGRSSEGTRVHSRPLFKGSIRPLCGMIVPASARSCPRVPWLAVSRNEGVRGSNPRVGFHEGAAKAAILAPTHDLHPGIGDSFRTLCRRAVVLAPAGTCSGARAD